MSQPEFNLLTDVLLTANPLRLELSNPFHPGATRLDYDGITQDSDQTVGIWQYCSTMH